MEKTFEGLNSHIVSETSVPIATNHVRLNLANPSYIDSVA